MLLSDLKSNEIWVVQSIHAGIRLFNRLASMGICEGTKLIVIKNSKNGPVVIEANGSKFAVGRGMSEKIILKRNK